ncbi:hypothetical protein OG894_00130 [Streptomyces sp. NBC_01724]|uniref:hypothetical protein n=1 Tax=unclassified Streptomyces TaxID=2593676 RepID=UPI002E319ED2|nr:hypothetical protein [Streptomyces sp. NBC_01724]WTE57326.1 hypothetical protein OG784_00110 [Streptomyces sp. NBC_01617]WTE64802.1 hypothetical protein OG784_42235 [Streptomyces sp. NBC_01617]
MGGRQSLHAGVPLARSPGPLLDDLVVGEARRRQLGMVREELGRVLARGGLPTIALGTNGTANSQRQWLYRCSPRPEWQLRQTRNRIRELEIQEEQERRRYAFSPRSFAA